MHIMKLGTINLENDKILIIKHIGKIPLLKNNF